jgi:phage gpG-like protein
MAAGELHISVMGEDIVSRRLLRFEHSLLDASLAYRKIATMLNFAAERQFATEGTYGGERWAPLAASTIATKQRKGMPDKILVATGKLQHSLTGHGDGHIERITPLMLEWGSSVPYGVFHMKGTSRMPARPPVKLPETLKVAIMKTLQRAYMEAAA